MKYFLFFISFSISSILALAQEADTSSIIKQTDRLEIPLTNDYQDFTVISGEGNGLMVVSEVDTEIGNGEEWNILLLDTTFQLKHRTSIASGREIYFKGHEYADHNYFLLFGKQQIRQEELTVIKYNATNGDTTTFKINTVFPIDLEYFEVIGSTIIFGGYAYYKPVVMLYNMNTKLPKVISGIYNNVSSILDVIPNDQLGIFSIVMSERLPGKQGTVTIKSYTADGTPIQDRRLDPGENRTLLDAASTSFLSGYQYVAGTYAKRKSEFSRGLYVSRLKNGIQESMAYHNYGDLENFFVHFSDRKEKRVKERIQRRKALGKRIKFNYRLTAHNIIEQDDQYILIGEAYYPRYRNSSQTYGSRAGGFGGQGLPNSFNPYFIGYKYTHAVVVAFDKTGSILWDNSFEINDVETRSLREYVKVHVDKGSKKIVLMYLYDNKIRSKVIEKGQIIEGKTINPVKLTYETDKAKSSDKEKEGIEKWYGNKFYAYGTQKIKNITQRGSKASRKIFYINKIEYEKNLLLE